MKETRFALDDVLHVKKHGGVIGGILEKIYDFVPDRSAEITSFSMTITNNMPLLTPHMPYPIPRKSLSVRAQMSDGTSLAMYDVSLHRANDDNPHDVRAVGTVYMYKDVKRRRHDP